MAKIIRERQPREFFMKFVNGEEKVLGVKNLVIPERSVYWKELNKILNSDDSVSSIGWRVVNS